MEVKGSWVVGGRHLASGEEESDISVSRIFFLQDRWPLGKAAPQPATSLCLPQAEQNNCH